MKRLIILLLLAGLAFYGAWPAYSGYTIREALVDKNKETLSQKIDFPSVRESLRPAVSARVHEKIENAMKQAGPVKRELLGEIGQKITPKITDAVLAIIVTPDSLIRIYDSGRRVKDSVNEIIAEQVSTSASMGGLGELIGSRENGSNETGGGGLLERLGKAAERFRLERAKELGGFSGMKVEQPTPTNTTQSDARPKYGLDNIKNVGLDGPFAISLGLARNPAAKDPDLTVEMGFVENDWKLIGLVPKL